MAGGIRLRAAAGVLCIVAALLLLQPAASASVEIVRVPVRFDVAATEIIPGVAAFRASCVVHASGEPLVLRTGETRLTTIGADPGRCDMILSVLGADVGLPVWNATPLGRHTFYLPGVATLTLGLVDVSVDLQTALNATVRVGDASAAAVDPENLTWGAWSVRRVAVSAADGHGSYVDTEIVTTFAYAMSIGLTIYGLNVQLYHADVAHLGTFPGSAALRTPLRVDLLPPALALEARDVRADGALFTWTGEVPSDADRLELWLHDGAYTWSYRIEPGRTANFWAPLANATAYEAWIVVVDRSGQATASPRISFATPGTNPPDDTGISSLGLDRTFWTFVVVGGIVAVLVVAALRLRGRLE